jgi:hypothetical protein
MIDLSMTGMRYPLEACLDRNNNDVLTCLDATNLAQDLKVPTLIIESLYDEWSVENLIGTNCLGNKNPPFEMN